MALTGAGHQSSDSRWAVCRGAKVDRLCDGVHVDGAEQVVDDVACGQRALGVVFLVRVGHAGQQPVVQLQLGEHSVSE